MQNVSKSKSQLIQPWEIVENVIGFSNKWFSLFWGCLFYYIIYINDDVDPKCEKLFFFTKVQSFLYLIQYFNLFLVTESIVSRYRRFLDKSKQYVCVFTLISSLHNFFLAFLNDQNVCKSISALNRVHGIFLFIYVILGLLFAFLLYVQINVLKDKQNKKK